MEQTKWHLIMRQGEARIENLFDSKEQANLFKEILAADGWSVVVLEQTSLEKLLGTLKADLNAILDPQREHILH